MGLLIPHVGGRPISTRIVVDLIAELKTGIYAESAVLPAEVELAARYRVSRSVIRDALGNLEREGFVERIRGIGTLIHRDIVNLSTRFDLKYEHSELILAMGCRPVTDSIKVYLEPAGEDLAEKLRVTPGSEVIVCEKRLLADSTPVIYSIDRLPLSFIEGFRHSAIDWSISLFDILEQRRGIAVDTDIAHISSVIGAPHIRCALEVAEDESLILLDEVGYYKLSHPIFQTYGYYTNFFEFTMLRKRF